MGIDRAKYLDADETKRLRLVTEAANIKDLQAGRVRWVVAWAVVDSALQTGLRVSELAKLTIGDVDFRRSALRVHRSKRRKSITETIPLSKELRSHLKAFIEWKKAVGQPTGKGSPLFVGKRGALTASGLMQLWKRAVAEAGLPRELSIHCARHTLAVALLKKSGNLRLVQKQLGHTSPTTTANIYADVTFEDQQAAVNGLYE